MKCILHFTALATLLALYIKVFPFFFSSVFQTAATTPNFDEIKKIQNPEDSQGPEVDAEF